MKNITIILIAGILIIGGIFAFGNVYKKQQVQEQNVQVESTTTQSVSSTVSTSTSGSVPQVSGFTLADVAQHNSASSCWLAIDGNVYDVTSFIPNHPGGQAILQGCGKDVSALYAQIHDDRARALLPQYKIGILK